MSKVPPSHEDDVYTMHDSEDEAVCRWRLDHLLALGIDSAEALALSYIPDIEHRAEDLIKAGCPPHIAARILL